MVAQIQVIEANPWCQENQTKSSMRGKQRWFLRRRAHRARAERRALSSRVASCLVSTGIPLKVLQGYRKWSQSPRRVAISSQLSWSCTFGHWNISRCSVSKLDGQSTINMYGTEVHTRRRSFTSQIPAAAMPLARRIVFFLRQFACPTTQGVSGGWKARQESLQHRRLENIWQFFFAKMMAIHALACSCHIGEYVVLEATALARGNIWSPSSAADGAGRRVGRKAGGHCAQSLAFKK